jgi:ribulose-5-phosphate 4-epimerase/fuculose-1-phosphate aldolase
MSDLVYNHITARVPGEPHHFLINQYGLLYAEMTASSFHKLDLDGNVVFRAPGEYGVNQAGYVIHSAVHAVRHDVECVIHTHTRAGCAVAAQQGGLLPLNQISMEFYDRVAYHDYEGIALSRAEQVRLVDDLGDKPALILRNHGLLTVGLSPAQAFLRMYYLNRACQIQVDAMAGGSPLVLPSPEVAERTARQFAGEDTGDDFADPIANSLAWRALHRLVERTYPDYAD